MENGKTTSEGLCLSCAKELGIAPINQMIDNFGVSDEELENINNQMSEFMEYGRYAWYGRRFVGNAPDRFRAVRTTKAVRLPLLLMRLKISLIILALTQTVTKVPRRNKKVERQKAVEEKQKKTMLDTYGTNLTEKAARGEVDRVVNRDAEIERVIQILNRRSKNNPVLWVSRV